MKWHAIAAMSVAAVVGMSGLALAQDQGGQDNAPQARPERPNAGGPRGGGPGGGQARMQEMLRERLQVTEEEWGVLQPKIDKVMEAQRGTRGAGFGGRGFGRGPGGPGGNQPQSPVAKASQELSDALQQENTSEEEINKRLAALREARAAAETELKAAREDLRSLLTPRQEAALVVIGMLD